MKKFFIVLLTAGLMFGMSLPVLAQEGIKESAKFTETLVTQIKTLLNADSVLGTPIEFEGTKIIPVVGYGFGFGAGSGAGEAVQEQAQGSGAGSAAVGGIVPTALLVITKDGEVTVLPAKKGVVSELVSAIAPIAKEAIKVEQMRTQDVPKALSAEEEKKAE